MAQRVENPSVDDIGQAGFVFTATEFETLLAFLAKNGIAERQIAMVRNCGFIAPIERGPNFEWIFQACKAQNDVRVLAICRDGCLDAMKKFIDFRFREGTWPKIPD